MSFSPAIQVRMPQTRWLGLICLAVSLSGCATNHPNWLNSNDDFVRLNPKHRPDQSVEARLQPLASVAPFQKTDVAINQTQNLDPQPTSAGAEFHSGNQNTIGSENYSGAVSATLLKPDLIAAQAASPPASTIVRGQSPDNRQAQNVNQTADGSQVQPAAYQYPELAPQGGISDYFGSPSPRIGAPGEYSPLGVPYTNYADLEVIVQETQTGRINIGGAYNSDNGLVGQFIIDERNFDIWRPARSVQDLIDGTAWRGGGQAFRLELVPGSVLQRYLVSISDPYFLNTDWSASVSGYYFDRIYFDWSERRLGGRVGLGRRIDSDISITTGLRMENVSIRNPRLNTSPTLNAALGRSNLFLASIGLVRDTRDNQFMATAGDFFSATVSQAFGDYTFTRGDIDYRRYRLLYERPDGSGRHTVSVGTRLGVSSSDTPIFENYFAGGFSSLRGFDFRGVGPMEGGVRVGGPFEWISSVEYLFPITADDMIKGVAFCDFGTVESSVKLSGDSFRVAPGFGFRVHLPAAGFGAPLAFDFGFPVASAAGDEKRVFSFYLGMMR
jgi:outer membrane protein insertion porin family